ncbi:MAG: Ig domain-containing protein [Oscillospiraceae bacterium]|nr:Ig domain-containing protein [Oscillospiraceae bacterium]
MKKTLSLFLVLVMALSVITVAGTAASAAETASVNGVDCYVGNTVIVTYDLKTPGKAENFQGQLNYSSGLKLVECLLGEEAGVMTETEIPNIVYYSGSTTENPYDFTTMKNLVTAKFEVVGAGAQTVENKMYIISGVDGTDYYNRGENNGTEEKTSVEIVKVDAESVTLNINAATVKAGATFTLTATVAPELTSDKTVTFTSDNEAVATVDANGVVTAVGPGKATITATCGSATATCVVTVKQPVSKIKISGPTSVKNGKTVTLKATVTPADADNKTVTWSTSNKNIAKVSANGVVTGVKPGKVTITAKANDGSGVKETYTVTVKQQKSAKITGVKKSYTLKIKKSTTVKPTLSPKNTYNKNITVTLDKKAKKIVKVSAKTVKSGKTVKITALKKTGNGKITFKAKDNSKVKVVAKITVRKK